MFSQQVWETKAVRLKWIDRDSATSSYIPFQLVYRLGVLLGLLINLLPSSHLSRVSPPLKIEANAITHQGYFTCARC